MQPESSSRHRGGPMPNRWCVNYTGCRFNTELTTRCLCWHTWLWTSLCTSQRINCRVNARTLHSSAPPLLIQLFARTDFAKHCFWCTAPSVWNSLPVSVTGSDSLSVFKSRLKTSYFVGPLTSTHNRLPPAPLKLRPSFTDMLIIIIINSKAMLHNYYHHHYYYAANK